MKINCDKIVFREDLYPRFETDHSIIQKYADSIELLPPIKINQNNILIDGFHRWKAHQLNNETEIKIEIVNTQSEKELKKLAYITNSNHGIQLSNEEKRKYANEMIGDIELEELMKILSVGKATIYSWTKNKREDLEQERNRKIIELYLNATNTQESIAEMYGITKDGISKIINKYTNSISGKSIQDFNPLLYNIWNTHKGNETSHFGSFPKVFMDNLLYYHTEPLDIIFDPFAGQGTTVDSCKGFFRRYYCSDLVIKPGREKDIFQHDITKGLPENLPKPDLVFIDPPYWKQAEKKYSNEKTDLGNMSLEIFNKTMSDLLKAFSDRKVKKIAIVIQPTQYKNDFVWTDHIFDFDKMLPKYKIEMRYILPYSTEQYNAQMVTAAKEKKKCLCLNRDLIIWNRND